MAAIGVLSDLRGCWTVATQRRNLGSLAALRSLVLGLSDLPALVQLVLALTTAWSVGWCLRWVSAAVAAT